MDALFRANECAVRGAVVKKAKKAKKAAKKK